MRFILTYPRNFMTRPEEGPKITTETPKQIIRIMEIFNASVSDRITEGHDLSSSLRSTDGVYQYQVFTESSRGFFYCANSQNHPHFLDGVDVIITHLLGDPKVPEDNLVSRFSEIEQFVYPDIEDLLRLLHQKGLNIPVILYSTFADHCLLPTNPLLAGSVKQILNRELNYDRLRTSINKAFEERQRQRALKPQN